MSEQDAKQVMLIDDDRFLLDAYSLKFRHEGFSAMSYLSVDEALKALRGGMKPDAILFDLVMPEKDGFALLKAVKDEALAPGAMMIALTNQMADTERAKVEEMGATKYLVKASVIPSEVVGIVREELAKKK